MSAISIIQGHSPVLIVVTFLLFSYVITVLEHWENDWCAKAAVFAHVLAAGFIVSLTRRVFTEGTVIYEMGGWAAPWGIEFVADYLAIFMLITICLMSFLILIYATEDLKHELRPNVLGWFYTLYLLLVGSMMGLALTNDMFNMFVFMEIGAISACGIISIKSDKECVEASLKYLIMSSVGTGCILMSIALIYMVTGHLNISFAAAGLEKAIQVYPYNILGALALFSVGFVIKSALFPLHVWLPDAHSSAPSPSSAILSGLVIKIYVFMYLKLLLKLFPSELYSMVPIFDMILILASLSIFFGSIFAIVQKDIKRMLAFSSIAQIGYVFLGIGLFNVTGLTGGILHIINHAMMKSMLFLSAGAIIYCSGRRKISDLKGIGLKMPLVMGAFTIGAMSMVGLPATNGFISKLYLALGALDAGKPFYLGVILLSSFLNVLYYFPIVISAFFGESQENDEKIEFKKLPARMSIPLVVLSFGIILLGIFPKYILIIIERAIGMFL